MCWNVRAPNQIEDLVYMPLVKGTSAENERVSVLERVMEVVSENDQSLIINVVNLGRSSEFNQNNQTSQIQ